MGLRLKGTTFAEREKMHRAQPSWCLREGLVKLWMSGKPKKSRILDVGAGSGETERQLTELGFRNIRVIDLENYLDKKYIGFMPEFFQLDVSKEAIPFDDESFDVVFLLQMLEHLENPWHCIREVSRVTKKGADVFLAIPFSTSLINRIIYLFTGNVESYSQANNHLALFSDALLKKMFDDRFVEVERYTSEGFIRLPFGKKIRFRRGALQKLFARKIAFHLQKC